MQLHWYLATLAVLGTPPDLFRETVIQRIRDQRVGMNSIADFNLPHRFVGALADQELRKSYQQEFHVVYDDGTVPLFLQPSPPAPPQGGQPPTLISPTWDDRVLAEWKQITPGRPDRRGYRAPILGNPLDLDISPRILTRSRMERIAERQAGKLLATEGLVPTTGLVIGMLGPQQFVQPSAEDLQRLWRCGIPMDWLAMFRIPGTDESSTAAVVDWIATQLMSGQTLQDIRPLLRRMEFAFTPTHGGFAASVEDGSGDPQLLRVQLPRGDYWRGTDGGDGIDMTRQLVSVLPPWPWLASIPQEHVDTFVKTTLSWPLGAGQFTLVPQPLPISQWAQDFGKAGGILENGQWRPATLAPRFASFRDDGSEFSPGDSLLMDGLVAAGHRVIQSPLLFQGGNMLVVEDPARNERLLLLSEAEVLRNRSLGLDQLQVLDAFRAEFGVDRCIVLPMASFHLDYDLTVRQHNGQIMVFVNDVDAAIRIILEVSIGVLRDSQLLSEEQALTTLDHLQASKTDEVLEQLESTLRDLFIPRRAFPTMLANAFSKGPADSGIGNLQRFLVALDLLRARSTSWGEAGGHSRQESYYASFRRTHQIHEEQQRMLRDLGWTIHPIPSLPAADRSMTAINGVHLPGRYLMPAHGGLFSPLDQAAAAAFSRSLGSSVEINHVLCAESQRRAGAVHCSMAVYSK